MRLICKLRQLPGFSTTLNSDIAGCGSASNKTVKFRHCCFPVHGIHNTAVRSEILFSMRLSMLAISSPLVGCSPP